MLPVHFTHRGHRGHRGHRDFRVGKALEVTRAEGESEATKGQMYH
jgi:hypothetical protein